jgi:GH15 family glucan-1,4-alpha-glucosidase
MPLPLEDYALIGDRTTAALVGRDGSIDWWCVPRFDAPAVFAALLGTPEHGRWLIAPSGPYRHGARRYRGDSLILETEFETDGGAIRVTDFMPPEQPSTGIVRIVEGMRGTVDVRCALNARFGYGELAPWTRAVAGGYTMVAVGDALMLQCACPLGLDGADVHGTVTLHAGERRTFALTWFPSCREPPEVDAAALHASTERFWRAWSAKVTFDGPYAAAVRRSLIPLKALISEPYGASIAAVTTSLPEALGGAKNWDYRYSWVRDAAFTVDALLNAGLVEEARRWRDWVLRALAGRPDKMQIMYGIGGERVLIEYEVALPGYQGASPVRIGNGAFTQFQLGVYGHLMAAMYLAHRSGVEIDTSGWEMLQILLRHVEDVWEQPDAGIWESRAAPRHYTQSKAEAWHAVDCGIRMIREFGYPGPLERWQRLADRIHAQVCERGYNPRIGAFVQTYDDEELDASVLLLPLVDFLPGDDERIVGTVRALECRAMHDGFLFRTTNDPANRDAPSGPPEGAFLACNFWLVENYVLQGRLDDARTLFERLLAIANDVGLLSEEYDPRARRLVGNIPQTFSHAALVNAAKRLQEAAAKVAVTGRAKSGA